MREGEERERRESARVARLTTLMLTGLMSLNSVKLVARWRQQTSKPISGSVEITHNPRTIERILAHRLDAEAVQFIAGRAEAQQALARSRAGAPGAGHT